MARKKRKEERKKRLKSLVLLLFLTIILLSTSTYAWFTANRSVSIDPINVNIAASSGLQISTDASEWKTLITNNDIKSPTNWEGNTNMLPSTLAPVSTAGKTSGRFMSFYKGVVAGDANNGGAMSLTASACPAETKGTTGDYIAFDIYLKVDEATGADIFLENGSGVTVTTGQADKGLQYAARYGFVIEGNVASTADPTEAQALGTPSSVVIVEPNYDAHKASGTNNASTYYNQTTTTASSGAAAVPYLGVKAVIEEPIILVNTNPGGTADSTKFEAISGLMKTNVAYSNAEDTREAYKGTAKETALLNVFHLNTGITKIRVYMWIEGQDVDCENSASGAFLTYKLGFTLDNDEETTNP